MIRRRHLAALAALPLARPAVAQEEPTRLIVNFSPGASLDGVARLVADRAMRDKRGVVVVENRPGAGGAIGAAAVARARPNGRTLLATLDTTLTVSPHLSRDIGFDPLRDLVPVAMLGTFTLALLVHPANPATTLRAFLDDARRTPVFYASAGVGSPGHLVMEHLRQTAGLPAGSVENVPQRGNAEATTALLSGTVPAGFIALGANLEMVRAGRLRPLAVSGAARNPALPEVPTVAEAGLPGFDVRLAMLLMAPRGTPAPVIEEWAGSTRSALSEQAAGARLAGWGLEPPEGDPGAFIRDGHARWARVVREAGMRAE